MHNPNYGLAGRGLVDGVAERCFGGYSGGETPGLIPNPEAKPSSADGTALGRVWESRTPPDLTYSRGPSPVGVGPRLLLCVRALVALDGRVLGSCATLDGSARHLNDPVHDQ